MGKAIIVSKSWFTLKKYERICIDSRLLVPQMCSTGWVHEPKWYLYLRMKVFVRKRKWIAGCKKFMLSIFRRSRGVCVLVMSLSIIATLPLSKKLTYCKKMCENTEKESTPTHLEDKTRLWYPVHSTGSHTYHWIVTYTVWSKCLKLLWTVDISWDEWKQFTGLRIIPQFVMSPGISLLYRTLAHCRSSHSITQTLHRRAHVSSPRQAALLRVDAAQCKPAMLQMAMGMGLPEKKEMERIGRGKESKDQN